MRDRGCKPVGSLLCVVGFPANTGYAWNFIESLYAGVADVLAERGIVTWVAYPRVEAPPAPLRGSAARAVELPAQLDSARSIRAVVDFVRRQGVRVVYYSAGGSRHLAYPVLRMAGVRRIVVHDHTSGSRTIPAGVKRLAKRLSWAIPPLLADRVIGVSDYVARRKIEIDLLPPERVLRIWNSVPIRAWDPEARARLRRSFGLDPDRPVIASACRAAPEKGIAHLFRAFDRVAASTPRAGGAQRPALVYMGDGPGLPEFRRLREGLAAREDIIIAGYRDDAPDLAAGADICVVPSVWEEAFGLAALEPMAHGIPVVASRVGGLPEVVVHEETGLLVPPGDEDALAGALRRLLAEPETRRKFGENGRRRAEALFSREEQIRQLVSLVEEGFECQ